MSVRQNELDRGVGAPLLHQLETSSFYGGVFYFYYICIVVWKERGFKNTIEFKTIDGDFVLPYWLEDKGLWYKQNAGTKERVYFNIGVLV